MNTEYCAQSVRNVRVCCLVVRTRVCQMFPFTSYNPLGHHQSTNLNCHVNTFFANAASENIYIHQKS